MRVVIAGGSGFLGRALAERLVRGGHQVVVLSRDARTGRETDRVRVVAWTPNGDAASWATALDGADAVVNLAGAGIADRRWTKARKQLLYDSRIQSTRSLKVAVRAARVKPGVFIQASGIGIFGAHGNGDEFDETSPFGSDFLARLCVAWEAEARPIAESGCRVVIMRNGVVLSRQGGALARMLPAFQFFVGGRIASGRQYMSWIHLDDWIDMAIWAIEHPTVSGPLNATSPNPVRNTEFARALGRALHRPSWAPVPGFVLRLIFGEMATDCLILGQRAIPRRPVELGYRFRFERIDDALAAAVRRG